MEYEVGIRLDRIEAAALANGRMLAQLLLRSTHEDQTLEKILVKEQEALDAIKAVADLTTRMGTAVQGEADSLQKVSDGIDAILAGQSGTVPDSVAAALGALKPTVQSVSDNLDTHAGILAAILAKEQPAVPTTTLPDPTPAPSVP